MENNYFVSKDILIITLVPQELDEKKQLEYLKLSKNKGIKKIIFDLRLFKVITSDDIKAIETFENLFRLNNCDVIVCNISVESASIIFYFVDEVKFKTVLDIENAINAFQN